MWRPAVWPILLNYDDDDDDDDDDADDDEDDELFRGIA